MYNSKMNIEQEIIRSLKKLTNKKFYKSDLISDLDIDSLDLVELIVEIEERHDVHVSDEDLKNMKTVQHIIDCLQKNLDSKS